MKQKILRLARWKVPLWLLLCAALVAGLVWGLALAPFAYGW